MLELELHTDLADTSVLTLSKEKISSTEGKEKNLEITVGTGHSNISGMSLYCCWFTSYFKSADTWHCEGA